MGEITPQVHNLDKNRVGISVFIGTEERPPDSFRSSGPNMLSA